MVSRQVYRRRLAVLVAPALLAVPAFVHGQTATYSFIASTGSWNVPANWDSNLIPGSTIQAMVNTGGTAILGSTDPLNPGSADTASSFGLVLGNLTGNTGTLILGTNGQLTTQSQVQVGGANGATNGSGTLMVSGGTLVVGGNLNLGGNGAGAVGYSTMSSGSIATTGAGAVIAVGNTGATGTFLQSGGTVTATGTFAVGRNASGFYQMSGGTLNDPTGSFQVSTSAAGIGTITQTAGTISVNTAQIGVNNTATYTMNGGTLSVASVLALAGNATGAGRGIFRMGSATISAGNLDVGFSGTATFTQNGGTISVGTDMLVGGSTAKSGSGSFTQTAGGLSIGGNLFINSGFNTTCVGQMFSNGNGSITLTNPNARVYIGGRSSGTLSFCATGTGTATLTSTGTLQVGSFQGDGSAGNYGARLIVGGSGGATPTVNFGTIDFGPGNNAPVTGDGQTRLVLMNSGTLNVNCMDLTSYYVPSVNQAELEYVGGTMNIGSIILAGGRYYDATAGTSQDVLSTPINIRNGGSGAFSTFTYAGGGTIQTSGLLTVAGPINNAGSVLNIGSISADALTVIQGTVTFTGSQTNSAGSGINVTTGQVNLQTDAGPNLSLTVNGPSSAVVAKAVIGGGTFVNATENLSALSIGAFGSAALVSAAPAATPALLLHAGALNITSGGTLDVAADDVIVDNGNAATIHAQIISGRNGGAWNGVGIQSSRAAGHSSVAGIGYASVSDIGTTTFDGVPGLASSAVLMKYTLLGDSNLDGIVNTLDFNALASNFGANTTSDNSSWAHGDYNYDGTVNSNDFDELAGNFGGNVAALGAALPDAAQPLASLGTVVPEPVSFAMIALAGVGMMQRRRRA